jgi:hypothetical protein
MVAIALIAGRPQATQVCGTSPFPRNTSGFGRTDGQPSFMSAVLRIRFFNSFRRLLRFPRRYLI